MAYKYHGSKRTTEDVDRASKESSSNYDNYTIPGITKYKPREGENRIRVMPPPDFGSSAEGKEMQKEYLDKWGADWAIIALLHRNVGSDETTYLCRKMKGKSCIVCDMLDEMEPEEKDQQRQQKRPFCYVIDRDNEKAGPQFWDMPMGLYRDINLRSKDRRSGAVIYIDDPDEGYDIMFTREGTGKKTKYAGVEIDRDSSPLHDSESKMERWLQKISEQPLPDILRFYSPDHIESTMMGASKKRDEDEEDEDVAPKRRRRGGDEDEDDAPPKRRRPAEDDDEEDAPPKRKRKPADDEEDEDEPPKRRRKPADDDEEEDAPPKRRRRDDDEDEDEPAPKKRRRDDDDEDEEDAPKRRRKPADDDEDEDEPPKRRKKPADDDEDEDEPAPRKRRKPADEDEEDEDETPPKRRRGADADEDEDEAPTARARKKVGDMKRRRTRK
jgi:hypothetical protein